MIKTEMRKVYVTSDKKEFVDQKKAEKHQNRLDFSIFKKKLETSLPKKVMKKFGLCTYEELEDKFDKTVYGKNGDDFEYEETEEGCLLESTDEEDCVISLESYLTDEVGVLLYGGDILMNLIEELIKEIRKSNNSPI